MCGFVGLVGPASILEEQKVADAMGYIHSRGPDYQRVDQIANGIFGHCRLAILDLDSRSNQPFYSADKRYILAYNGEIYNYKELKSQIDYPWQTESDTEVVLAYYQTYGKNCVSFFDGMFAFAIWDMEQETLFMARDKMGVKPLYFRIQDQTIAFSSNIRALQSFYASPTIEPQFLAEYLGFLGSITPHTVFKEIQQLKPGHVGFWVNEKFSEEKYFSIEKFSHHKPLTNASNPTTTIRKLLENAVAKRMVSDVPVSSFLSGGMDSSIIAALMARMSSQKIETFSLSFSNPGYDESPYALQVAKKVNSNHHHVTYEAKDVLEVLPHYFKSMDSPTVDGLNTYLVSKQASQQGMKVAMSGIGGDELFAGYQGFKWYSSYVKLQPFLLPSIRKMAYGSLLPFEHRTIKKIRSLIDPNKTSSLLHFYKGVRSIYLSDEIKALAPFLESIEATLPALDDFSSFQSASQYSIAELSFYTRDILLKDTDQMSMAFGLEVREPFFDIDLIQYVLSMPDGPKFNSKINKPLLATAFEDLLPNDIIYRKKMGFVLPIERWLKQEWKDFAFDSLTAVCSEIPFQKSYVDSLWNDFLKSKNGITWMHIWSLVVLYQWSKAQKVKFKI